MGKGQSEDGGASQRRFAGFLVLWSLKMWRVKSVGPDARLESGLRPEGRTGSTPAPSLLLLDGKPGEAWVRFENGMAEQFAGGQDLSHPQIRG